MAGKSTTCHRSFPSIHDIVLIWGVARWLVPRELTPAEQLIEETRTLSDIVLRAIGRAVKLAFAVSLILGAVNAPLILSWQNIVSPVGILLGPPLVFLTSVALLAGFVLLIVAVAGTWAAWPFAFITR